MRSSVKYPDPWDVRTARHKTGFTLAEAADLVFVERKTWLAWERNPDHHEYRAMHPAFAQLFALKAGLITIEEICPHLVKLNER